MNWIANKRLSLSSITMTPNEKIPGSPTMATSIALEADARQAAAAKAAEEHGLVRKAQEGDRSAFDELVRRYDRDVLRLAMNIVHRPEDARDIYQETFLKVYRNLHRFRFECSFYTWLYRVATNAGLDALRRNARRRQHEQAAHVESLRSATVNCALERILSEERRARVQAVLAEMKPRDAQLLVLRADGLAYRELADSLGVQASSIGTLLARAEAEFERKFRARYGDAI